MQHLICACIAKSSAISQKSALASRNSRIGSRRKELPADKKC
jgi:hypothetical protein